ncbi:hypothetical protein QYE76_037191 [Lolium multiflorum]|uniref:Uncharacterized protein n=1 Tax=Lolium multiflorum TaxID=4521 RepID=A0AAD8QHF3_LOLMU|nr:hypothetical protein QYE76_037191 [Lolium multiflorum]
MYTVLCESYLGIESSMPLFHSKAQKEKLGGAMCSVAPSPSRKDEGVGGRLVLLQVNFLPFFDVRFIHDGKPVKEPPFAEELSFIEPLQAKLLVLMKRGLCSCNQLHVRSSHIIGQVPRVLSEFG